MIPYLVMFEGAEVDAEKKLQELGISLRKFLMLPNLIMYSGELSSDQAAVLRDAGFNVGVDEPIRYA